MIKKNRLYFIIVLIILVIFLRTYSINEINVKIYELEHKYNRDKLDKPQIRNFLIINEEILNDYQQVPNNKQKIKFFFWKSDRFAYENFGNRVSYELVKRIVGYNNLELTKDRYDESSDKKKKFLAIGSIIHYANQNDVVWGSGMLNQFKGLNETITKIDVRSMRGPMSRTKLMLDNDIIAPEIYGDPALLVPYFFPEFKRSKNPKYDFIVIPHLSQIGDSLFDPINETVVWPTENYKTVINKILDTKLVISVSLQGLIIAESFGIPARLLNHNNYFDNDISRLFKYKDHYFGTKRFNFRYANSIKEALEMGGESPVQCDLDKLYNAFPKEFFDNKLVYDKLPSIQNE